MAEFFILDSDIVLKLVLALVLGMLIGTERLLVHKSAGMKTHALVALGSALFIIISEVVFLQHGSSSGFDPSRMAAQIVVGIGFLGAGSGQARAGRHRGSFRCWRFWLSERSLVH